MKQLPRCYAVLWAFSLLLLSARLSAQAGLLEKVENMALVDRVKPLETTEFVEKYVIYFSQPLDHRHPKKGSFHQRVIVAHVGFDRPTVIVTEGYGAAYAMRPGYREELSRLFNANMIFVEHRFFLESTPEPRDWKYLTAENSAKDLHAVTAAFKTMYPGKWISTGISKGGQTSLLYRAFFPDDVDISVPYVAPLCYGVEDGRHEPFLQQVSTVEERKKVEDFQLEVLKRKSRLLPRFETYCTEKKYVFRAPLDEIYDFCVLEYSFALWQWGTEVSNIPSSAASDEEIFRHLLDVSDPSYFTCDSPNVSFFVQAARELGYYGYDIEPFREYLSIITPKFCESISQIWQLPIVVNNLKTCPYRKILTDLFLRESVSFKIIELDTVESIINTVAAGGGISLLPKNILRNKFTVNEFDIPEVEPTSINVWIHKDSVPSDFITFKEIIESLTCYQ